MCRSRGYGELSKQGLGNEACMKQNFEGISKQVAWANDALVAVQERQGQTENEHIAPLRESLVKFRHARLSTS